MRKIFMGVRLRTLREQRGMTQAALAALLDLSPSYVNQLENNERPLSVAVQLRLQTALGVDLQFFSEDEEARLLAQLHEIVADSALPGGVPQAELRTLAQQMPSMAQLLMKLHGRMRSAEAKVSQFAIGLGERDGEHLPGHGPHEEVREFFYTRDNHISQLDDVAESLFERLVGPEPMPSPADLGARLEAHLDQAHGVRVRTAATEQLRHYDPAQRLLTLSASLEPGRRAFHAATLLAYLEARTQIDALADAGNFSDPDARALSRLGLASYFAGALVLPYGRFLQAAQEVRYDIALLSRRFGVSFETVCHRLSTLQRPQARGVPFFFVRVDRAGNISKRQSATDFHFSRSGGTCPLWNVYEAFAQPGRVLTQVARMPDGRNYLWMAVCETRQTGGYGSPERSFAIGLGCELRHAAQLVYAKGLDLSDPDSATPIGPGCKLCEREGCEQRAFPALGRRLRIDENTRFGPYAAN